MIVWFTTTVSRMKTSCLLDLTTLEQTSALKEGRIDIGFGRLRYNDDGITRRVIREEKLSVVTSRGHALSRRKGPLKLKHTAGVPLILYPNAPRPSYADQVLLFYRNQGVEPNVAFEVRQLWTVLGLGRCRGRHCSRSVLGAPARSGRRRIPHSRQAGNFLSDHHELSDQRQNPAAGTHPQAHRRVRPVD
jgi:hypothetical protein